MRFGLDVSIRPGRLTGPPPDPPDAPSGLTATANGDDRIDLAWTDNSDDETGFLIERSPDGASGWTQVGDVGVDVVTFSDTGLSQKTEYFYRVRSYNAGGTSSPSNADSATTEGVPDAPSGLTATAVSSSQIDLAWTDNSDDETGFTLERSPNGSSGWTEVATPAADAEAASDTGLDPETTYHYRIAAVNAHGQSSYSNVDSATTDSAVSLPATLTVTNGDAETGDITGWTSAVGDFAVDPSIPHTGTFFFVQSTNTATGEAYQDVAIPVEYHALIDAGGIRARLVFWQAGFSDDDSGKGILAFLDSEASEIESVETRELTCPNAVWCERHLVTVIPADTRTIRIEFHGTRFTGTQLSTYYDDITLQLEEAASAITDIPDLVGLFDAEDIVGSDDDPVSTWPDSSGNGNDLTQTGGNRPTLKTGIINGRAVARFVESSSQYMVGNGIADEVDEEGYTIFAVAARVGGHALESIAGFHDSSGGNEGILAFGDAAEDTIRHMADSGFYEPAVTSTTAYERYTDRVEIDGFSWLYDGDTIVGTPQSEGAPRGAALFSVGQEWDGGTPSDFLTGDIAYLAVFSRHLNPVELQDVWGSIDALFFP